MKKTILRLFALLAVPLLAAYAAAGSGNGARAALKNNNGYNSNPNGGNSGNGTGATGATGANDTGPSGNVPGSKNFDGAKTPVYVEPGQGFQGGESGDDPGIDAPDQPTHNEEPGDGETGGDEPAADGASGDEARPHKGLHRAAQKAEDEADAAEASAPRPVYKDSVARALKYTAQKKYGSASAEYNKALAALSTDDPRKVYVYERLGWLALMQNDIPSAEGFYVTAANQAENIETYDKDAVSAYRGAAFCYERDGDIPAAIENYSKALKYTADKEARRKLQKKIQTLKAGRKKK
jgi:tetratricopeptide (TPR) repeat protein